MTKNSDRVINTSLYFAIEIIINRIVFCHKDPTDLSNIFGIDQGKW